MFWADAYVDRDEVSGIEDKSTTWKEKKNKE